jgi:uncharacterized protein DUF6480
MTVQPPDPDPAQTPGLEPGGGVLVLVFLTTAIVLVLTM